MSLTAGTRVGSFVIQAPIGAGGMGEVYLAGDARLRRRVALKVIPPHPYIAKTEERRNLFRVPLPR